MSSTIRPASPYDLEAVLEAALGRPRDVDRRDPVVREPDEHHRVVLAGRLVAVDERRAPGEHVADAARPCRRGSGRPRRRARPCRGGRRRRPARRPRSAAACGPLWPSRARNVVSRPIAPASIISRIRIDLAGEDDVLEVGVEDAGLLGRGGASRPPPSALRPSGFVQATALPCAAAARTASTCRWLGSDDDDEVDLGVGADGLDRIERPAAEALGEGRPPLGAGAEVGDDPDARHVAQAERVELADEPGPEHADPDLARASVRPLARSRRPTLAGAQRRPCAPGSRRASPSSRSPRPASTPSAMTSSSASSVRTPPAALTPTCGAVLARIRRRSSWVAPLGANPVEVLTKSPPAASVRRQARIFSSSVR